MTGQQPGGVIYMLHFDRPYRHAKHYVGWTDDLFDRLDQHAAGRGARLVAVIWHAGIGFTLIRICEGTRRHRTRHQERRRRGPVLPGLHPPAMDRPLAADARRLHPPHLPQPRRKAVTPMSKNTAALAATSAPTPTSSTSCSSSSTAPRPGSPGGGAPNSSPCPSWPPRGGGWTPGPASLWAGVILGGLAAATGAVPHSRRFITRRAWCVLARHRLQRLCYEARLHTRSGRLPLILWTRPTKVGERTWVLCRAGICAEDFEDRIGELRAACYARDARVTRNRRWSHLITIDIIRRDTLAAREIITSPLERLTAHYHIGQLELVPPLDSPDEDEPAA